MGNAEYLESKKTKRDKNETRLLKLSSVGFLMNLKC